MTPGIATAVKTSSKPQANTLAMLLGLIVEVMGDDIELYGKETIDPENILTEVGMDSLAALNLQENIKNLTGVEIPIVKLLDKVSIRSLAKYLDAELVKKGNRPMSMVIQNDRLQSTTHWEEGEI